MQRRTLLRTALAASSSAWLPVLNAQNKPVPLADAHSHLGLIQKNLNQADFLNQAKESGLALMAWCVVPDGPWLRSTSSGIDQASTPGPGQVALEFNKRLRQVAKHLQDNGIQRALTRSDIDAALTGEPRVVLASEGADFVEGDLTRLDQAYAEGLRHTQLVHYIASELGDLQTIAPRHGGLTPAGRAVIEACNRLGILMDLAHCDASTVARALEVSTKPMIWSHGWISPTQGRFNDSIGLLARRISWLNARQIVDKGGVIGLWSVGISDGAKSRYPEYPIAFNPQLRYKTYATGIAQMVKELGADHVCFGTDIEGVGPIGVVNHYRELRQVVDLLSDAGLSDAEVFKVCIGNYARVLKTAMNT
jgi:membrane dipeptidase